MSTQTDMMLMMKECMKRCRICSVVPIALGIAAFLLGYFIDAETVRILWLVFSGLLVLFGILIFLMISSMLR